MNRIVKEHYPVEKLPEDLRVGLGGASHVRITVVVEGPAEDEAIAAELEAKLDKARADVVAGLGLTPEDVRANLQRHAALGAAKAT